MKLSFSVIVLIDIIQDLMLLRMSLLLHQVAAVALHQVSHLPLLALAAVFLLVVKSLPLAVALLVPQVLNHT